MLRIGEFSKMAKTTIKTLRYYDEEGLLKPEAIDKSTGYRFYATGQLVVVHKIQSLRQIGISIGEIKLALSGNVQMKEILEKRKAEMIAELAYGKDQLSRIEFILSGQEDEDFMNYQANIKKLPECVVYSKDTVIPGYDTYFKLIPSIGAQVEAKYPDLKCTIPAYCFVRYLDGEYKEKDIHIEFCEAVDKMKEDFEDIKFKKLEAVSAVTVMHKGPYNQLGKGYSFIMRWIEENGYVAVDSPRENYIDGIWNKESDQEWLTEIQVPVMRK